MMFEGSECSVGVLDEIGLGTEQRVAQWAQVQLGWSHDTSVF